MDTLNRFHYSLRDDSSDKIIFRGTNHLNGTTGESIHSRTSSSPLPSPASEGNKKQHHVDTVNHLFALQTKARKAVPADSVPRMPLLSSASGFGAEVVQPPLSPVVSLVSPEMEQEIESLNSIIAYINTELQALANEDENDEQADDDRVCQNEENDRRLNHPENAAGGDVCEARNSDEILIHHPKDQQHFSQPDPTTGPECRLTFCQKSLHDSTDTVIDGCSSKDMSSSADFSDENDVLSKTDLTASEDELIDEGIQCNSADQMTQMIPFNHFSVLEFEAFLRKHRVRSHLHPRSHFSLSLPAHDSGISFQTCFRVKRLTPVTCCYDGYLWPLFLPKREETG